MKAFVIILTALFFSTHLSSTAQTNTTKTEQYIKALKALQKKDTTSAVTFFKESINQNGDAPSYFKMAKIYSSSTRLQDFSKAYSYINEALNKDGKNIEHKLLKAFLKEELFYSNPLNKTYRNEAISLYEEIVREKSDCEPAWFNLGRLNKEDYMKYMNSEYFSDLDDRAGEPAAEYIYSPIMKFNKSLRRSTLRGESYDKFRATLPKPVLKYTKVAAEMFRKSEEAFSESIKLAKNETSFSELLELYLLSKNYTRGSEIITKYRNLSTEPVKYYLDKGMTDYLGGNIAQSEKDFKKGFDLMNKSEREIYTYHSFKKLLRPEKSDSLSSEDKTMVENYFNKYMQDNDPLFLTEYNERLLEHFTRVAYSNMMFSVERLGVEGWSSDRGEVVIRYGIPDQIKRMRSSIYISPGGDIIRELAETETFYYSDKNFSFYDVTRRGNFHFNDPTSDNYHVPQSLESTIDSITAYREKRPEAYIPKLQGPLFETQFAIYQLPSKSPTRTDICISFLINPKDSSTKSDYFSDGYTTGIFLFDKTHKKTTEKINEYPKLNSNSRLTINTLLLNSPPREGNIAFEILRKKDNGAFTYHDLFNVKKYPEKDLSISDLVMCFDVGHSEYPSYIRRNETYLLPNPSNYFTKQMQLFIYYEINNLSLNSNNLTDFEQKITIQKKEEGGVLNSILSVVGLDKEGKKVALTSKYQTQEKDPQMYLQLDMSKYEPGEYLITVSIKDNATGMEVSGQTIVNWQ